MSSDVLMFPRVYAREPAITPLMSHVHQVSIFSLSLSLSLSLATSMPNFVK